MASWTARIHLPEVKTYKPGEGYVVTRESRSVDVIVEIDIQRVADRMGVKAWDSKSRKSKALSGAIVVKRKK